MPGYRMSEHDDCCKNCKDRYPGCHDHCERGKEAERKWKEYKASVKSKRDEELNYLRFKAVRVKETKEKSKKARRKLT